MAIITLEEMEFYAHHGCLEHEKQLGNTFWVTVSMELDTSEAGRTDNLRDTLNYQLVYDVVDQEMKKASNLIEHVAQRIADRLFRDFVVLDQVTVRLSKQNPPLGAKVPRVSIEIQKKRS